MRWSPTGSWVKVKMSRHAESGGDENIVNDGDVDSDQIESAEEVVPNPEAVRVGPGRPKLIHTGEHGRISGI